MSSLEREQDSAAAASDGAEASARRSQQRARQAPVVTRSHSQKDTPQAGDVPIEGAPLTRSQASLNLAATPATEHVSETVTSLRDFARLEVSTQPSANVMGTSVLTGWPTTREATEQAGSMEVEPKVASAVRLSAGAREREPVSDTEGVRRRRAGEKREQVASQVQELVAREVKKVLVEFRQQLLAQTVADVEAHKAALTPARTPRQVNRCSPAPSPRPSSPDTEQSSPLLHMRSRKTDNSSHRKSRTRTDVAAPVLPYPELTAELSSDEGAGRRSTRTRATANSKARDKGASPKIRSNEKGIYMPTFDGTDWITFQIQFDTFCERYQLSDAERLSRLKLALEGAAARVLHSCEPSAWTLQSLLQALEMRYGQIKSYPLVERELRRVRRRPNQTLQDLHDEILAVSRKADMQEAQRCRLTRLAFMGALDDDIKLIHFIDKHDPQRASMATALKYAIQYERENGLTPDLAPTRLEVRQMTDGTAVSAYGSGPSPLMKLVEQNSKTLESVAGLLAQLTQSMQTMTGGTNKQENKPSDKGQVWPGSNYRGKNFIPNYKHPSQQDQQQQSQQQYSAAKDQNRGSQQAAQQATAPRQQTTAHAVQPAASQPSA